MLAVTVTVAAMQMLPPSQAAPVFDWLATLSYPWTSVQDIAASAPKIEALSREPITQTPRAPHTALLQQQSLHMALLLQRARPPILSSDAPCPTDPTMPHLRISTPERGAEPPT
jgi:hypothetical protein